MTGLLLALLLAQAGEPASAGEPPPSTAPMVAPPPAPPEPSPAPAPAPAPAPGPAPAPAPAPSPPAAPAPVPGPTRAPSAAPSLPEAIPLRLHGSIDKATVTLGEPFRYQIEVLHDSADAYSLPASLGETLGKGAVQLRGEPTVAREPAPGGARTSFVLPLAVVASLTPEIPALRLLVQGPSGPRQLTVPAQKVEVESLVEREGAPNAERAHHGPKPPEPVWVHTWLWAFLLAGLAALVAAAVALLRFRQRRAAKAVEPPPPLPPHEEAFRRLRELRRRAPWNRGEGRSAIFELSEIVRGYLGARLGFNAVDLTSEELVRDLRHRDLPGLDLVELAERLEWEALVKFAKLEPTAQECTEAIDHAGALVERTQERLARERHPNAAAGAPAAVFTVSERDSTRSERREGGGGRP